MSDEKKKSLAKRLYPTKDKDGGQSYVRGNSHEEILETTRRASRTAREQHPALAQKEHASFLQALKAGGRIGRAQEAAHKALSEARKKKK